MITKLILKNFKSVGEQSYDFTQFDLLVGRNNSGKSTVLQALAIWQFCVDEFHRSTRGGNKGIQVVLPNFTALPVPEFNLLWKDRTDRVYPFKNGVSGKRVQEFIQIEILVEWRQATGETDSFGIELGYHSRQAIYARPTGGWAKFRACEEQGDLPKVAYVPPFSGLEPTEKRMDDAPIRQQAGKGQPGSVLRNLLLRVCPAVPKGKDGRVIKGYEPPGDWQELAKVVERWFSVKISQPQYEPDKDVHITVEYQQNGKDYDIIAGGSGFHQTLTLLAFLYGYQPTTILLDEPDAHLHVNLQREILDYFKRKAAEKGVQFLIATHAEEFAKGVDSSQIVSLLYHKPKRIESTPEILRAMADVSNDEITQLMASPYILYVEGESDERILRAWAGTCGALAETDQVFFKPMWGGTKALMKKLADEHFDALRQIVPEVRRLMLFDYDDRDKAFRPAPNDLALAEWKRKNIENYLLVPEAWRRAALRFLNCGDDDLFAQSAMSAINTFFIDQNLTLASGKTWRNVSANIFSAVNGKRILFEDDDSLFHTLRKGNPSVKLIRESVAAAMTEDEIHEDVHGFFAKLRAMTITDLTNQP